MRLRRRGLVEDQRPTPEQRPVYVRLLRLHSIHPNGVARALLGEGMIALAVVLSLADLASAWSILVLPVAVAVVVKAHDLLAALLQRRPPRTTTAPPPEG